MLEAIFRYVARALAAILEKWADPNLQAKLDAYNAKAAAQEQKIREAENDAKISEALYQKSLQRRNDLNRQLADSEVLERELERELAESNKRIAKIKEDAETVKKDIDSRSDNDVLRGDL